MVAIRGGGDKGGNGGVVDRVILAVVAVGGRGDKGVKGGGDSNNMCCRCLYISGEFLC